MERFVEAQALAVGPLQRRLGLARHLPQVDQGAHLDVLGLGRGFHALHEVGQREAGPRNDHRPGFHAAHPVDALLEWEPLEDVFHVVGARLAALAFDLDRPRLGLQRMGVAGRVALVQTELVEVVVGGDVAVGVEFLVGAERALLQVGQLLGRRILGQGLPRREHTRRQRRGGGAGRADELPAAEVQLARGHLGLAEVRRLLDQHVMSLWKKSSPDHTFAPAAPARLPGRRARASRDWRHFAAASPGLPSAGPR